MASNNVFDINVNVKGTGDVDKLDKSLTGLSKTGGKAASEIQKMRKEIKDAKSVMLTAEEGSKEYAKALATAANAQFKLKDINDKARLAVQDFGQTGRNVAQSISGLAGGFGVLTGALALFGVENDAVLQTIMKLQAVLSVTAGIGQFADSIDSMRDLFIGLQANSAMVKGGISEISDVSKDAADNMANLSKETAVISSNLVGGAAATNAINTALKETVKLEADDAVKLERLNKLKNIYKDNSEMTAKVQKSLTEIESKYNAILDEATGTMVKKQAVEESANKATETATKSIGKQLLTMGLWVAAVTAVIAGIGWLIDKLNEIPEDVKVKIEIESEAVKKSQDIREKLFKFQEDVKKAQLTHNNIQLDFLEKYAEKEFGYQVDLQKTKLSDLEKWSKIYLKTVTDMYYNEAIIKKGIEAQIAGETALATAKTLFLSESNTGDFSGKTRTAGLYKGVAVKWTWDMLVQAANDGTMTGQMEIDLGAMGIPQQIIDQLRIVNAQNAIINALPKLKKVKFYNTPDTTPTGGSKSISLDMQAGLGVVGGKKVKTTEIKGETYIAPILPDNLAPTKEQLKQQELNSKLRNGWFKNTREEFIRFDLEMDAARREDLDSERIYQEGLLNKQRNLIIGFAEKKKAYDDNIKIINNYLNEKTNLQNNNVDLDEQIAKIEKENSELQSKVTEKNKKATQEQITLNNVKITGLKKLKIANDESIANKDVEIKKLEETKKGLEDQLKLAGDAPDKMKEIQAKIDQINTDISNSLADSVDKERELWKARAEEAQAYLGALSNLSGGIADLAQADMDITNKKYDAEAARIEESVSNEADKNKQLEANEEKRYEALKKSFELQKTAKIAQAWMDFAAGTVALWATSSELGPIAGPVLAGIETAALLATTIANTQSIASQTLDAPKKASGSSSSSSGSMNLALAPQKTSLTSSQENLNKINNSSKDSKSVVLVSDVNKVQSKVDIRENNANY